MDDLELKDVVLAIADDICVHETWNLDYMDVDKYNKAIVRRYFAGEIPE